MNIFVGKDFHHRFEGRSIYETFLETVSRSPNNFFVLTDNAEYTFEALATRIEDLALRLGNQGVKQGHAVMLQMPRGPEFITAALAVTSLGCVFVPLAVNEPEKRAHYMCNKVGATHLLNVEQPYKSHFGDIQIQRLQPACAMTYPPDTAYILHTSGTTGMPKGVIIPSRALLNCLAWHIDFLQFSSSDRISHLSRPTFDFSIPEMFLPVVTGAAMVVPGFSLADNLPEVVSVLAQHKTSTVQLVPTLLSRFLRYVETSANLIRDLQPIRHMVCNGEALSDTLRRRFYRSFPHALLHNCYGPTEACVAVTAWTCPKDDRPLPVYIGKPAHNVSLYLLRADGSLADENEPAELWIGGSQNGLGYANDPLQTEEKFREVTLLSLTQRLYRTGDWVVSAGNQIGFIGRRDSQVKFHGVRIELAEIQKSIELSNLCSGARVLLAETDGQNAASNNQMLACFVTPEDVDISVLKT